MPLEKLPMTWPAFKHREQTQESMSFPTFRLNLAPTALESGLRLVGSQESRALQIKGPAALGNNEEATEVRLARGVSRMMFASMVLIVVVLCILIFTLLFVSYRFNSNVNYYYALAEPYIQEVTERGMSIVRHADHSSAAMEHSMAAIDATTSKSLPSLMATVNRTTDMVARLDRVARNPVLKVSME